MARNLLICILAALLAAARGDLEFLPENVVAYEGDSSVVLRCDAAPSPGYRVMWTEFTKGEEGQVISDGRTIIQSHPNSGRYRILGSGETFDLEILNVQLADGGTYLCQDILGNFPAVTRGTAELITLNADPVCDAWHTQSGAVVEDQYYTSQCEIGYQADLFKPNMTWTGPPGDWGYHESITDNQVMTITNFYAHRSQEGYRFECLTKFNLPENLPDEAARNIPTYQHLYQGTSIVVVWPPKNMYAVPIKTLYDVGDEITCHADSKPNSTYLWMNMRTQVQEPVGAVFTVRAEHEGLNQTMRCTATVMYDGSLYPADHFINVDVRAATTTPPTTLSTTTTPAPADGPCNDPTGRWSSTNPTSQVCIEMDGRGNLLVLIRNGTDPYFVAGNGKTVIGDHKHIAFTGIWPDGLGGVAGFTGECHSCYGSEVILMSGLSRDKRNAPGCGESAGTQYVRQYVLTRFGEPCRAMNEKVYRPSAAHIKYMGIKPENIIHHL